MWEKVGLYHYVKNCCFYIKCTFRGKTIFIQKKNHSANNEAMMVKQLRKTDFNRSECDKERPAFSTNILKMF